MLICQVLISPLSPLLVLVLRPLPYPSQEGRREPLKVILCQHSKWLLVWVLRLVHLPLLVEGKVQHLVHLPLQVEVRVLLLIHRCLLVEVRELLLAPLHLQVEHQEYLKDILHLQRLRPLLVELLV